MVFRLALTRLVREFDVEGVRAALEERPDLLNYRDDRGRNWLHLTASISIPDHPELSIKDAISLAGLLTDAGLPINDPACTAQLSGSSTTTGIRRSPAYF